MRGLRTPRAGPAAKAAAGVPPTDPEPRVAAGITVRRRILPPRRIAPLTAEGHVEHFPKHPKIARFAGRWLVVSEGGDCLLEYASDANDALLSMPLGASCSLVAAILQFMMATSEPSPESAAGPSTHAVMLGGLLLSICRASGFSVVAVTQAAACDLTGGGCAQRGEALPSAGTAILYKAMEIHCGLSTDVGASLLDLVKVSAQQRQDKLDNYTLSSMLDDPSGESIEHLMDARTSATAQGVFSAALQRTYSGLVEQALALLTELERTFVVSICIFDHRLDLLAHVTHTLDQSNVTAGSTFFTERYDWLGADLIRVAADKQESDDSNQLTFWCWVHGCRDTIAALGPSIGPLRVGVLLRAEMGTEIPLGSSCGDTLGVMKLPLSWESYEGASWVTLEVSRVLAATLGVSFEWPADISCTRTAISWAREVPKVTATVPPLSMAAAESAQGQHMWQQGSALGVSGVTLQVAYGGARALGIGSPQQQYGGRPAPSFPPVAPRPLDVPSAVATSLAAVYHAVAPTSAGTSVCPDASVAGVSVAADLSGLAVNAAVGQAIAKVSTAEALSKGYLASLVARVQNKASSTTKPRPGLLHTGI